MAGNMMETHDAEQISLFDRSSSSSVLHASLSTEPPSIVRAEGHYLHTSTRTAIYDTLNGAAVSCIGDNHPRVKRAMQQQLNAVEYCFAPHFTTPAYEKLARFLVDSTNRQLQKVFVTGSGSEAIEATIKMARQFMTRDRSYYGNTLGALDILGYEAWRTIYKPLLSGYMSHVSPCYPYHDLRQGESTQAYVERLAQELEDEFQRVSPRTLGRMTEVYERRGALFILDGVFAGMGRTGSLHAWEGVVPDLQTVAKGLGAGYAPVGALMVGKKIVDVLDRGTKAFVHFQTYDGHPLACAAVYEVQQVIHDEGLVENCGKMGDYLGERLRAQLGTHPNVGDLRGRGLAWASELVKDRNTKEPFPVKQKVAPTIHAAGLQKFEIVLLPGGGVVDGVNGDLVVLAPAYDINREEVDLVVQRTATAIDCVLGPTTGVVRL
ncbi:PLP-dependent transferase [Karstenula rhodostoma CBS 690.94]|uniref:PLP-dependent transferase n=1 Tax=Karstenula rhodostoma CBS 690.94 TaxID=1392251 RepID=A0A9P4PG03_9PLEO|nr:PLP-dependent transferase [Karstenula rhodostoma CBS 690.94]